jgi:N-acetyl-gamma-glutamyl-phosphate reductase
VGNHRHTPEIEQILTEVAARDVEVIFTPHLTPMDRGIFATIYATPVGDPSEKDLIESMRAFYAGRPFVRIVDHLPATKDVAHTNYFDATVRVVRGKVVVLAVLDNLIKGAAGVAVQNLNLVCGFPETTGLM